MSIRRITVSVPEQVARRIKRAAGALPVSTWVTSLIEEHLDNSELEHQWDEFCRDVNPGREDIRRSDVLYGRLTKSSRRRSAA